MQRRVFLSALRDGLFLFAAARLPDSVERHPAGHENNMDSRRHIKLFLGGDVMTGRGIDQVLPHPVDPVLYEGYVRDAREYVRIAERANGPIARPVNVDYIWGEAFHVWRTHEPDVRIVNLETSVTVSDDNWPSKGIHYRMHPHNVACLNSAQLDCCVLANNHVLDWGHAGLAETLVTLHTAGIETAGAGLNLEQAASPARLAVPGKGEVLVYAAAEKSSGVPRDWSADHDRGGVNLLPDLSRRTADRLANQIRRARAPGDLVVLSIHWGGNWGYAVPREQRGFAHRLIDAAAVDIVHGHSSHHAKALELYGGKVIIYGCGDFVNDYEGIGGRDDFRPWLSPMYFVTFDQQSGEVARVELEVMRMRRFRLTRASVGNKRWLTAKLNEFGDEFATCLKMRGGVLRVAHCIASRETG